MLSSAALMFLIEFLSTMKTIPMPMLKARYISSSSTLPKFCKTLNNPSFGQVSFKILTEVYFQLFCLMYFQQLFREDLKIKNLFIISILSLFINPMGLILVGFTLIIIISNWLKINVYLLILLSIIAIIFFIPLVLTFLLDALNYNNIIDYKNLGRLRFLEKGNIIYFFLYYDQGAFKWCNDYCNFYKII